MTGLPFCLCPSVSCMSFLLCFLLSVSSPLVLLLCLFPLSLPLCLFPSIPLCLFPSVSSPLSLPLCLFPSVSSLLSFPLWIFPAVSSPMSLALFLLPSVSSLCLFPLSLPSVSSLCLFPLSLPSVSYPSLTLCLFPSDSPSVSSPLSLGSVSSPMSPIMKSDNYIYLTCCTARLMQDPCFPHTEWLWAMELDALFFLSHSTLSLFSCSFCFALSRSFLALHSRERKCEKSAGAHLW